MHHDALHDAINQLHQEADSLAAVASLCYKNGAVYHLEHVHAAHLQHLLQGFAPAPHDSSAP